MIRSQDSVAVLGAGISGLSAAWYLKKHGMKVTLFEKENRPGGWIAAQNIEGFFFEKGPHSIRGSSDETFELIEELGLTQEVIWANAKQQYLLHQGSLEPLPSSIWEAIKSPLMRGLWKGLICDLCAPRYQGGDESIDQFFTRRFSKEIAHRFIDPLISGIFAGDPKKLSLQACFPALAEMEKQHRSLILGSIFAPKKNKRKGIATLRGGLEQLTNKLGESLKDELRLGLPVEAISLEEKKIYFPGGSSSFDAVVSALPAHALAKILPEGKLKGLMQQIPFSSVGVVHLGYQNKVNPFEGFGYLVPSSEKEDILGVIFDSSVFPLQDSNNTRLTVMIGGTKRPDLLEEIAKRSVQKHLGIKEAPSVCHAYIAKDAIAQYPVGFSKLLDEIRKESEMIGNFHVLGTSFDGVSVNQAVLAGKKVVEMHKK